MKTPCDEAAIRARSASHPCPPASRGWVLAATILASSMAFIDSTVVNVALPAIQSSFHASVVDVQWVVESYGLFLAALILAGGSLGDLLGRRKIFLLGVVIFAASSLACGLAPNVKHLIIARSFQGIGGALLVPGSLAIISSCFDEQSRGQAIGTWSGFTAITTAIGPVIGGWLVEHASWRWAFFLNLPLATVVIAVALRHIPESRSSIPGRIDWWGAILATLGLAGLVTGFLESTALGWADPVVYGSLGLGFILLIAFFIFERRTRFPMVPLELFHSRNFSGANLLTLFLYAAIGIFFFLFPLNLIQVQKYTPTAAGAAALPFILLMFLLSRWSGGLVAHYGARTPLMIGPLVVTLGFLLLARPSVGGSYWTMFFPGVVVLGLGMATTVAPLTTLVMNSAGQDRVGAASGINNAVARLAGVLAIAILGAVMVSAFGHRLNLSLEKLFLPTDVLHRIQSETIQLGGLEIPAHLNAGTKLALAESVRGAFVHGFRIIMLICAGLSLASAGFTLPTISRRKSEASPETTLRAAS